MRRTPCLRLIAAAVLFTAVNPNSQSYALTNNETSAVSAYPSEISQNESALALWRAAEEQYGNDAKTAERAFAYAELIFKSNSVSSIEALERTLWLIESGISSMPPEKPRLMLAYARYKRDKSAETVAALRALLDRQHRNGVSPSRLSAIGWYELAVYAFRQRDFEYVIHACGKARDDFESAAPGERALLARVLQTLAMAHILKPDRRIKDIIKAHAANFEAMHSYSPQTDIRTFDKGFASAYAWDKVIHAYAIHHGATREKRYLDEYAKHELAGEPQLWIDTRPSDDQCGWRFDYRAIPKYPVLTQQKAQMGTFIFGYDISADDRPVNIRLLAATSGHPALQSRSEEALAQSKLADNPQASVACRKDRLSVTNFILGSN